MKMSKLLTPIATIPRRARPLISTADSLIESISVTRISA